MKIKEEKLPKNILARAKNVSMEFKKAGMKYDTLKERAVALFKRKKVKSNIIRVLENVNFEIKKGESLGVIGHNGAGKSTLLKIIAGIYRPTEGMVQTNGKVMLLNLGAGFDMEADAVENIYLNGAILGFTRKQMKEKFNSIIEFSELGDFMDMPLKNYSSGMISRLGFAIAINIEPELLLVDEVLSVGDANFQKKCQAKIDEFKEKGVSFMFVSHSIPQVRKICEKTLWIENSKVMAYGDTKEVCDKYTAYCANMQKEQQKQVTEQAKQETQIKAEASDEKSEEEKIKKEK